MENRNKIRCSFFLICGPPYCQLKLRGCFRSIRDPAVVVGGGLGCQEFLENREDLVFSIIPFRFGFLRIHRPWLRDTWLAEAGDLVIDGED